MSVVPQKAERQKILKRVIKENNMKKIYMTESFVSHDGDGVGWFLNGIAFTTAKAREEYLRKKILPLYNQCGSTCSYEELVKSHVKLHEITLLSEADTGKMKTRKV